MNVHYVSYFIRMQ